MSEIVLTGESGKPYHFQQLMKGQSPTPMAGVFVFVKMEGSSPVVIYIGQSASIYNFLATTNLWAEAVTKYAATDMFAHMFPSLEKDRKVEKFDLVQRYSPPLNPPEDYLS